MVVRASADQAEAIPLKRGCQSLGIREDLFLIKLEAGLKRF